MPFEEEATVEQTKRKDADRTASVRERAPRRLLLLLLLLLLIGSRMMQALLSETVLLSRINGGGSWGGAGDGGGSGGGGGGGTRRQADVHSGSTTDGVFAALELLRRSHRKYVIVDAKNGLGNRLRALVSAMSVAAALQRPVMLVWVSDLHCNCSFRNLFSPPLPFALLEEALPRTNMTAEQFQVYNYMRPEAGAVKDAPVDPDPQRHLYFKSAFPMSHRMGSPASLKLPLARAQLRQSAIGSVSEVP